jgi:hypothetical protein
MRIVLAGVCAALAFFVLVGSDHAGEKGKGKGKPKYTISEVMEKAHDMDDGLLFKVAAGKGNKEDAKKLLELYTELAKNKPPEGDPKSWKRFTDGLIAAAQVAVKGGEDAGKRLKKAANCSACHKAHKG